MKQCKCVKYHSPADIVDETHHILPLSWGGANTPDNQVLVCAQTHYTIHYILNAFVRAGQEVRRTGPDHKWPLFAFNYALEAWHQRDPNHPTPFWLPEGAITDE